MIDVSIIITSYNRKEYLGRAIRSCLNQSFPRERYEIIVVDDCSIDKSQDVMVGYGEKIVPIYLDKNVGVAEASNIGIKAAQGKFIIRVDSDDYISNHTILFMYEILNANKDIGFVYADHIRVDSEENFLEVIKVDNLDLLLRHGAGIMFRKSYLEAIGLYDGKLRNAEDFDLLKRYIKNFNGYHLKFPSYRYRIHDGQMTRDEEERKKWEALADENRK